jgi:hypothetical protein
MDLWRKIPKDYVENLLFRKWLYKRVRKDQRMQRALRDYCRKDILFWVNAFVFTFDPRLAEKRIPMITYPYQDKGILDVCEAIKVGEDAVMPKSRDMGASWILDIVFDHYSTFEKSCKFLLMSRKADYVDQKENPDSLMWKIDFIHDYVPSWLRPKIKVSASGERARMRIKYLDTGSVIIGETTTDSSGVGGRATAAGVDELSRYKPKMAEMVMSGLKDVTNCIIYPFTKSPEMGKAHPSYRLVESAREGNLRLVEMHWTQHPVKAKGLYRVDQKTRAIEIIDKEYVFPKDYKFQIDGRFQWHSPWFDKYRLGSNDRAVADNLEFDDEISAHSVFNQETVLDHISQYSCAPYLEGDLEYHEITGDPIAWTSKRGGQIRLWMNLDVHDKPPPVSYVTGEDTSLGRGKTPSCFVAARTDTGEKVLEFITAFMAPDKFAVKCVAICRWLTNPGNKCLLAWERQGPGDTFGIEVQKLQYYPIYYHMDPTKVLMHQRAPIPGVSPTIKSAMFTHYETDLAAARFINRSERGLREMFEWQNSPLGPVHNSYKVGQSDPSGAKLNHGDLTVADAMCAMMLRMQGGGRVAQQKDVVLPGSLAWFIREEEHQKQIGKSLYPNWNKQHA